MPKDQSSTMQKDSLSSESGVSANAILKNSVVFERIKQAYMEAKKTGIEKGGWIFFNIINKNYSVVGTTKGAQESGIILDKRFARSPGNDWVLVGNFHAHPGYAVASCRPSGKDIEIALSEQCHKFVIHSSAKPKKGRDNSGEWEENHYTYHEDGNDKQFIISHIFDSKERMLVRQKQKSLEHQEPAPLTTFKERQMQKHNGIVPEKSQSSTNQQLFQKSTELKKSDFEK